MKPTIYTDRLALKSPDPAYSLSLLQYFIQNIDWLKPWTPIWPADFLNQTSIINKLQADTALEAHHRNVGFLLFIKGEDRICGTINFSNIVWGGFCSCFLGYQIGEDYADKGLMTEALKAAIWYVFRHKKFPGRLHRIEANIMPSNLASINLVKKLGFINEGNSPEYLQIAGKWETHEHWVMLNNASNEARLSEYRLIIDRFFDQKQIKVD
ncbi:MAG: ribosomal-protein-alanine N-acetyltransferase [Limisphaerales bacterium]|jgi:ribosomal-protein-alanine N-acetyltransferase